MIFSDFTWWSVLFVLITTHITILTVTIYLHRCVAHRSLSVNKYLEHFFRFWVWVTTGQSTQEWAAVHRKHHAFCEKEGDPHSPKIFGILNVLFKGVALYKKEAKNPETVEKYGKFTPDDWIEHNIYRKHSVMGMVGLGLFDVALFGFHGFWVLTLQLIWIPFWAAGVVNGIGHFKGYRNFNTEDDSRNISPIGFIIGGEELHNNHHAYPTSAKLSMQWYEFDMGWGWIKLFEFIGLAKVNKQHSIPVFDKTKNEIDETNLQAFLSNKYFVLKMFMSQSKKNVSVQIEKSKNESNLLEKYSVKKLKSYFYCAFSNLKEEEQKIVNQLLKNEKLKHIFEIKENMLKIWNEKNLNYSQLLEKLTNWQKDTYQNGFPEMREFAQKVVWLKVNLPSNKLI